MNFSVVLAREIAMMLLAVSLLALAIASFSARQRTAAVGNGRFRQGNAADIAGLGGAEVLANALDVGRIRESTRRRRLWKVFVVLAPIGAYMAYRISTNNEIRLGVPSLSQQQMEFMLPLGLIFVLCLVLVVPMMAMGKSPHVRYDPSEISTTLDDVVGLGPVKDEVVKTLNLFLGYQTFRDVMGGNPRKGDPVRRSARHRQDVHGEGHGARGRRAVPVRVVDRVPVACTTAQTGRKIRNYFKELRKAAQEEGGAIGFIEEIDAIAGARSGMRATPMPSTLASIPFASDGHGREVNQDTTEGISGVVNELLIQLQSFDAPTGSDRFTQLVDRLRQPLAARAPPDQEEAAGARRTSS